MSSQPTLTTARLVLRPFKASDAAAVQKLAGAVEIADTTLNIPHPYLDGMAEAWIAAQPTAWAERRAVAFAITQDGDLRGTISLHVNMTHSRGELGFWIAPAYWGQGLATEAVAALLGFAFETLGLNRVQATHFTRNPASGRVMQKAGMTREGLHREVFRKNDRFEDAIRYAILQRDWKTEAR